MSIIYECKCGKTIEFPVEMAGRLATCRSCSAIFTLPRSLTDHQQDEPSEADVVSRPNQDEGLSDLLPASPADSPPTPAALPIAESDDDEDDDQEDMEEEESLGGASFWGDLVKAFEFVLRGESLMTFIILSLLVILGTSLTCIPLLGVIIWFLLSGYLCAYYIAVIIQSAMGEDELPDMAFDNIWDDVIYPFIRFVGSWFCVLVPALLVAIGFYVTGLPVDWDLIGIVAIIGVFCWPVTILMVAIANGFRGLSPMLVLRTIISAPIPYAVVILGLILAGRITFYVENQLSPTTLLPASTTRILSLLFLGKIINLYGMIVSMRIIGLFYRHYHSRFPWAA